jgi:hypothetical protein
MSTKRARDQQKKTEKAKAKAKQRSARSSRKPKASAGGRANLSDAATWSEGACYLSDNWYERGAQVVAVFSRRSEEGRVVAAVFHLDLEDEGAHKAEVRSDLTEETLVGWLTTKSSDDSPLLEMSAGQVAYAVREACRYREEGGKGLPTSVRAALPLVGDTVEASDVVLLLGLEETEEAAPEAKGWLSGIKRSFGFGE